MSEDYEMPEIVTEKPALIILLIIITIIVIAIVVDLFSGYGIFRRIGCGITFMIPMGSAAEALIGCQFLTV